MTLKKSGSVQSVLKVNNVLVAFEEINHKNQYNTVWFSVKKYLRYRYPKLNAKGAVMAFRGSIQVPYHMMKVRVFGDTVRYGTLRIRSMARWILKSGALGGPCENRLPM